jgi:ribosomal protein S18 acetylase RimI-like enzyme
MRDQLVIRPVRADEYEAAGRLVLEAYRSLGDEGDEFYEHELADVAGRAEASDVLVAELGGHVVGSVTYVDALKPLSEVDDPDSATIRMLGVATEARGRGVGEALTRECINRARETGRARVRLDTRPSMASAQRLYERLGFTRDPKHDWSPAPGIQLLSYVKHLVGEERPSPRGRHR